MTTNKPEVVAVMYRDGSVMTKQECGIVFNTCWNVETPLIRLTDYEDRMAVLFDGHAVHRALTDKAKQHTSPESVAAVLDAVVKLMREVSDGNQ